MAVSRINEAGLNVNQYGNRNVIINGAMQVAQRQTSSSNVGNQYVLDRFSVYKQNTGSTYTCSQNSVTDLAGFSNSLKMDCTTADTSFAFNEQVHVAYKAKGKDLQRFQKGHATALGFTLSFYVKTNKTGVYTIKLFDRDNTRDVSGSYTVADANWNRYTVNFPADTTGKFDDDNASSLEIFFQLVQGSDTTGGTLNTAWRSNSDASAASGQVNFADSTSNDWEITGVQLEVGDTATDFEHRTFADELQRCRRYAYLVGKENGKMFTSACFARSGYLDLVYGPLPLLQELRASPTLTYGGNIRGTNFTRGYSTQTTTDLVTYDFGSTKLGGIRVTFPSDWTAGDEVFIGDHDGTGFILLDAEL